MLLSRHDLPVERKANLLKEAAEIRIAAKRVESGGDADADQWCFVAIAADAQPFQRVCRATGDRIMIGGIQRQRFTALLGGERDPGHCASHDRDAALIERRASRLGGLTIAGDAEPVGERGVGVEESAVVTLGKPDEIHRVLRHRIGGIARNDLLQQFEAIVNAAGKEENVPWVLRSGAFWQHLPERYGKWKSVHARFSRWAKAGVWEKVFSELIKDRDNKYLMLDTTLVRVHQQAAAGKGGPKLRRWGVPEVG